ncbi:hypothetical protein [Mesorhizobium sp.]|uniref:hypothetical protein n=1 Tax=Mesorhizobium sp. TaxID=1871066 RepID=UPI000FEA726A|nr:hypothetical protein [Mesorhizobium sp.]RWA78221.1 MAG: hypothetical protein EOQ30_30655 [Mesorhizobium sp.]
MQFKERTLTQIAHMICGNGDEQTSHFVYRSSMYLTEFFRDCGTDYVHTGQTRHIWVADRLREILAMSVPGAHTVPPAFSAVIAVLMDQEDARNETSDRVKSLGALNDALKREGFEAFYAEDGRCYLRHHATRTVSVLEANPHRPMSKEEMEQRGHLEAYLDRASEDELIEGVLLPLFRQLGFQRISPAGHVDKALEYGKDVWMKYRLPTMNWIYFGIQAKRGKLDSSGVTKGSNANVAEILNQARMMLGHTVFDPEINRKVLVDHAFIVAGGEITKAARNWLGEQLDASQRSQIMFLERKDILDLYIVNRVALPAAAVPKRDFGLSDKIPF